MILLLKLKKIFVPVDLDFVQLVPDRKKKKKSDMNKIITLFDLCARLSVLFSRSGQQIPQAGTF